MISRLKVVVLGLLTEPQRYMRGDYTAFQRVVGDTNPLHFDTEYAKRTPFREVIAPGFYSVWRAEHEGHLFAGSASGSVRISFIRPIRPVTEEQTGDLVQVESAEEQHTLRYVRDDGTVKRPAIVITPTEDRPVDDLEQRLAWRLRHTRIVTQEDLEVLSSGLGDGVPYTIAAALMAPALRKHDENILGAYVEVTLHPHYKPVFNQRGRCAFVALAKHAGKKAERKGLFHEFFYTVVTANGPNTFLPVVSGQVKLQELQGQSGE